MFRCQLLEKGHSHVIGNVGGILLELVDVVPCGGLLGDDVDLVLGSARLGCVSDDLVGDILGYAGDSAGGEFFDHLFGRERFPGGVVRSGLMGP